MTLGNNNIFSGVSLFGKCAIYDQNYVLASASKFYCEEKGKVQESNERSVPLLMIPKGDFEQNFKVCKGSFNATRSPLGSSSYINKIAPFYDNECVKVLYSEYRNSGYETSNFALLPNITEVQIKTVSFTLPNLNNNDDNVTCSSFNSISANKVNISIEQQLLQDTSLFNGGTIYVLDHGEKVSMIYQNSTAFNGKYILNVLDGGLDMRPANKACLDSCVSICYEDHLITSIPITRLDTLNITAPKICSLAYHNVTVQQNGCYFGSNWADSYNVEATQVTIISREGRDEFIVNNMPDSSLVVTDFQPGVDWMDLSRIANISSFETLNITDNPATINLQNNQRISFVNISKSQLAPHDFTLPYDTDWFSHNPISVSSEHTSNNSHSNYAYFSLFAIPCLVGAVAALTAIAYKCIGRDKLPVEGAASAGGMVIQHAIEVGGKMIEDPTQQTHTPRFGDVPMPPPLYTGPHSPVTRSPIHTEQDCPYYSPTHSPTPTPKAVLSVDFFAPPTTPALILPTLPPLDSVVGAISESGIV